VPVLRPITDAEFAAWLEIVIPAYAEDKVASGQWSSESAPDLSRKEYAELLPLGKDTENNHIYTVLSMDGDPVGTLWFVAKDMANRRIAYVYDIHVSPSHRRRGHAFRAFKALEEEAARLKLAGIALHVFGHNHAAQALYLKLGYVTTNLNMFKTVAGSGAHLER
jgi:ribosomal protein S18 acetylase RimI-like enzyme